jgi:hypothetical protein
MPDLKSVTAVALTDAKPGDAVLVGESEITLRKADGTIAAVAADADVIEVREAVVIGKTFQRAGLLARRDALVAELAKVNAILAAVGM